jgi:putative endonuclease
MTSPREKGDQAENIAVTYLEDNGYRIIQRNWYFHHYELDVIAEKENILAVIEIKSLLRKSFQEPYQAVNLDKQRMIIAAANAYIRKYQINKDVRFDIISITFNAKQPIVEHIENAFYPRIR